MKNEKRIERQREFWEGRYSEDIELFGTSESEFARWSLPIMKRNEVKRIVELGCGYGRDMRFFCLHGLSVSGCELTPSGAMQSKKVMNAISPGCKIFSGDVFAFLSTLDNESADCIYSNMLYNMDFTKKQHMILFSEVERVLRPGGIHLYSVRSTSDQWYGKGKKLDDGVYDLHPDGAVMHFFSMEYAGTIRPPKLKFLHRQDAREGEGTFPISLIYFAEKKD